MNFNVAHVKEFVRYYPNKEIFHKLISFLVNAVGCNWFCIAGGTARYMLSTNSTPNLPDDIDVYCFHRAISYRTLENLVNSVFIDKKYKEKIRITSNLRFSRDGFNFAVRTVIAQPYAPNIQFISIEESSDLDPFVAWYPRTEIEKIIKQFDISVCQAAIAAVKHGYSDYFTFNIFTSPHFVKDEFDRRLRLTDKFHSNIMSRVYKYIKMGYRLEEEDIIKITSYLAQVNDKEKSLGFAALSEKLADEKDEIIRPFVLKMYEDFLNSLKL